MVDWSVNGRVSPNGSPTDMLMMSTPSATAASMAATTSLSAAKPAPPHSGMAQSAL
jgi:hypothetical protein